MHVWMFICRSNFYIFLWKDLDAIPNTDTIIGKIFAVVWCHIFVISRATGTCFSIFSCYFFITLLSFRVLILLGVLFRSCYLLVLCLVYCSLLYDPFVSFYPSIVLRHHSIILFVICVYLCMYHFPLWTCNSVLWLWIPSCRSVMPVYYHYYYYCYIDINITSEIRDRAI